MLRLSSLKSSADSAFRYKNNVKVSKHIREKDFGADVLLFGSPTKLHKEALSVLQVNESKSKAFWEVFCKRVNESIHLINPPVLCDILRALDSGNVEKLSLAGTCHFLAEDILTSGCGKYETVHDLLSIIKFLSKYSNKIDQIVCEKLLRRSTCLVYQLNGRSEITEFLRTIDGISLQVKELQIGKLLALKIAKLEARDRSTIQFSLP